MQKPTVTNLNLFPESVKLLVIKTTIQFDSGTSLQYILAHTFYNPNKVFNQIHYLMGELF